MKLSKALKVKNRVAGELSSLQDIYRRENSRREDNPSKVVASDVWNQITAKRNDLVKIKTAITKANIDIYHALAEMEELKGSIHYVSMIPTREGEEVQYEGSNRDKVTYQWTASLNQEAIDGLGRHYQQRINELQDEIDEYNGSTDVEL